MTRLRIGMLLIGLALVPAPLVAQEAPTQEEDALAKVVFEPELIMRHGRAIDLNDEQRDAISRMIRELQGRAVSLQWELLDQTQALTEIMQNPRVDQDRALDALDELLETEKEIKQAQLELLIRIKNVLRPEQQAELTRLRERDSR